MLARGRGWILLAAAAAPVFVGCYEGCEPHVLYPAAAAGLLATSCPAIYELDGLVYEPSCTAVPDDLLGGVLGSDRSSEEVTREVARSIDRVPSEDAVALRTNLGGGCGTWELGLNVDLTASQMTRVRAFVEGRTRPVPGPTPTS